MSVQVLVAAMNQNDHSLLEKMKIESDVIVANQCERNHIESFSYNGHKVIYLNFAERGVGLNRNNALMRATADYCLFADDDEILDDGYSKKIETAFERYKDADVIIFNIVGRDTGRNKTRKVKRINKLNYLKYGTARIAIRLKSIRNQGIYFYQTFGGGTEHCHGEDNLFLTDCLNKGLKIIAVPEFVATLSDDRGSTWDNGYSDKYFMDQGALYKKISPRMWLLLCAQDAFRRRKSYRKPYVSAFKLMINGAMKD